VSTVDKIGFIILILMFMAIHLLIAHRLDLIDQKLQALEAHQQERQ